MQRWWIHWSDPTVHNQSLATSIFVGTVLLLINQSNTLLKGNFSAELLFRSGLTYLVPYLVSSYTAVSMQPSLEPGQNAIRKGKYRCEACLHDGEVHQVQLSTDDPVPDCDRNNETEFVLYQEGPNENDIVR